MHTHLRGSLSARHEREDSLMSSYGHVTRQEPCLLPPSHCKSVQGWARKTTPWPISLAALFSPPSTPFRNQNQLQEASVCARSHAALTEISVLVCVVSIRSSFPTRPSQLTTATQDCLALGPKGSSSLSPYLASRAMRLAHEIILISILSRNSSV
jgi:hypothetical protein